MRRRESMQEVESSFGFSRYLTFIASFIMKKILSVGQSSQKMQSLYQTSFFDYLIIVIIINKGHSSIRVIYDVLNLSGMSRKIMKNQSLMSKHTFCLNLMRNKHTYEIQLKFVMLNDINFKIKLSYNQSTQMRSKGKPKKNSLNSKNQPLNINISFNINPKNILNHEVPLSQKSQQKTHSQLMNMTTKTNLTKHRKIEPNEGQLTQRTVKKAILDGQIEGEINQKQLQKIKKKFLNRINNMDITLALPENETKQQKEDEQSSLMSARMEQYDNNLVKKSNQSLQFNFNSISGKSKILTDRETSKVLQIEPFKKTKQYSKPNEKRIPILTFSKEGKTNTHYKGFSTFTDNKYSPQKYRRKRARIMQSQSKKHKPKQQNLMQKLERFKLDMMKLAVAYDQSEVLKTKISSQYYNNVRSREISKEVVDVHKINEVQQHEKSEQIKKFQVNQKELTPQQQSQSFKNLKDVYKDLERKRNLDEGGECTKNIVEYYTQLTSEPKCVIDGPADKFDQSQQSYHSNLWQKKTPIIEPAQQKQQQQKQETRLQQFIHFLQERLAHSPNKQQVAKQIQKLLEQYRKPKMEIPKLQQRENIQCAIQEPQIDEGFQIDNIDIQINKQLQAIPILKDQLTDKYKIDGNQMFELEQWEENYKNQLLKIKGKMWKEYKTIKNIIQNRIINPNFNQKVQTKKTKKQNKIMKCLSQKLLLKKEEAQNSAESLEKLKQQRVLIKIPKQRGFLIKQEHLMVERSLSDENSDSRIDLQIVQGQIGFAPTSSDLIPSKISDKQQNMLLSNLVKVQMEQKSLEQAYPEAPTLTTLHRLTDQDKEDIFQFIFLDICIQLYQEAVQQEDQKQDGREQKQKNIAHGSNRILKAIRSYIRQQKRLKKQKENRKIGFPTNVSVVKQSVEQMCQFAMSDLHINNSPLSNKQRTIKKLSSPLGPSETQILKSLRLSLFSNHPVDDYGEDVQQPDLLVLQPDLFLYYQNEIVKVQQLPFPKYYDDQGRDELRISFLRNCTHIHQKAIFDCLNESLDYHRTFGIWGKPFTWKRTVMFKRQITNGDLSLAMSNSGAEVVKCASFVCGLMVHKEDSLIKDIASDSSYVRRLQDERIYKLLQNFVAQMEEKWFFHDDQEAEVLIELSHIVWTILLKEVLKDLQSLLK